MQADSAQRFLRRNNSLRRKKSVHSYRAMIFLILGQDGSPGKPDLLSRRRWQNSGGSGGAFERHLVTLTK